MKKKYLFLYVMFLISITCQADIFDSIYKDSTLAKLERDSFNYEMKELKLPTSIYGTTESGALVYNEANGYSESVYFPSFLIFYIIGDSDPYYKCTYFGRIFYIKKDNVKYQYDISEVFSKGCDFFKRYFSVNTATHTFNSAINAYNEYMKFNNRHSFVIRDNELYDMSEYTEGSGYKITFINHSRKTIKYITLSLLGYNAVDDPVGRVITKKCIGPIDKDESGSYNFEYVWFSDIVEYAKITSVRIQYMDNRIITIKNPNSYIIPYEIESKMSLINEMEKNFEEYKYKYK